MRQGVEGNFDYLLCAEAMSEGAARRSEETMTRTLNQIFPGLDSADAMSCRMIYGEAPHEGPTNHDTTGTGRDIELAG